MRHLGLLTVNRVAAARSRQQSGRLYRRRNAAESTNRHLDDSLWLRRVPTIGHTRQLLNLLTDALGINGLALHLHRQRHAPPLAA